MDGRLILYPPHVIYNYYTRLYYASLTHSLSLLLIFLLLLPTLAVA
jgi:hypothetical protein